MLFNKEFEKSLEIIDKYYNKNKEAYNILIPHSVNVAQKAVDIALNSRYKNIDFSFIYFASMLHDIGIIFTDVADLGCYGKEHYLCHGYLGGEILRKEGLIRESYVCDNHIGVGLFKEDIINNNWNIPIKDYFPLTIEEEIISLADNFFSKSREGELTIWEITNKISLLGQKHLKRLNNLIKKFDITDK